MQQRPQIAITLDTDWAPDCVIHEMLDVFEASGVPSTWFVTNEVSALVRMRARPELYELGIHPNFLPRSSHGSSVVDVLATCMALVPEAVSMRTHGLEQGTRCLDEAIASTPVRFDTSLFMPRASRVSATHHVAHNQFMHRFPTFYMDDFEFRFSRPWFDLFEREWGESDFYVFDFHPIHFALNSNNHGAYASLKRLATPISKLELKDIAPFVASGAGSRAMLLELIEYCRSNRLGSFVRDLPTRSL
jgi:peptidoglycan/xylan/chitin deacetylase (PgdA/CDA1 family)